MKLRTLMLSAAACLALVGAADAATVSGWYVSLEGGGNWIDDVDYLTRFDNETLEYEAEFDNGWAAFASVGYGFDGIRLELEGGYRNNETSSNEMKLVEWSVMANALYDIQVTNRMRLSVGAGAGGDFAQFEVTPLSYEDDQWRFAYQGIVGLSYAINKRLDLMMNYRYLRVEGPSYLDAVTVPSSGNLAFEFDDIAKHSATLGLRYAFGVEAAPPPPPPPPPPPAEPEVPREFIVFFGHNQSDLTAEAQEVVRQAAVASKTFSDVHLSLVGHADRSGSTAYNDALSLKRALSVKGGLVKEGVAENSISVGGKGEGEPLVPTDDGVREPQNRRVHITM